MAAFTLCAGIGATQAGTVRGPQQLRRAASNWETLGLDQLLIGESDLEAHPQRLVVHDVATNANDDPCLQELLRCGAERTQQPWLLLVSPDALLSETFLLCVQGLCDANQGDRPSQMLVVGRAWRLSDNQLDGLDSEPYPSTPSSLPTLIDAHGILDPVGQFSWALIPRGALWASPASLGCDPAEALPWLISGAHTLGWTLLDATAAAPVARPLTAPSARTACTKGLSTTAVLPLHPNAPRLSLLVAAPESRLESLQTQLCPTTSLPWEVIARPADNLNDAGAVAAAWASGLDAARGVLAWPLSANVPPLALLAAVLRCFNNSGVELLQLGWQLGNQPMPIQALNHLEPGCLVAQTAWLKRVGGIPQECSPAMALQRLRQLAERRGANTVHLPLPAIQHNDATFANAR